MICQSIRASRAHPRAGGENAVARPRPRRPGGSSPRRRGKQNRAATSMPASGLIPAQAGKTGQPIVTLSTREAHPRAGGENLVDDASQVLHPGSSPRRRGKRRDRSASRPGRGLIPAQAGKTVDDSPEVIEAQAHPRAGGENTLDGLVVDLATGSSPRRRGKRSCGR